MLSVKSAPTGDLTVDARAAFPRALRSPESAAPPSLLLPLGGVRIPPAMGAPVLPLRCPVRARCRGTCRDCRITKAEQERLASASIPDELRQLARFMRENTQVRLGG